MVLILLCSWPPAGECGGLCDPPPEPKGPLLLRQVNPPLHKKVELLLLRGVVTFLKGFIEEARGPFKS